MDTKALAKLLVKKNPVIYQKEEDCYYVGTAAALYVLHNLPDNIRSKLQKLGFDLDGGPQLLRDHVTSAPDLADCINSIDLDSLSEVTVTDLAYLTCTGDVLRFIRQVDTNPHIGLHAVNDELLTPLDHDPLVLYLAEMNGNPNPAFCTVTLGEVSSVIMPRVRSRGAWVDDVKEVLEWSSAQSDIYGSRIGISGLPIRRVDHHHLPQLWR